MVLRLSIGATFLLLGHVLSQYNQYTTEVTENGTEIWRSTSEFIPEYGQSFGNLTIRPFMSAEFDFIWWGRTFDPSNSTGMYDNFFRVGFSGDIAANCQGHASRYPSFWITPPELGDKMHVSVSELGVNSDAPTCSKNQKLDEYGDITVGEEYHVKIYFNQTTVLVGIGLTQNFPSQFPEWSKAFDREVGTASQWLGLEAQVWWMSNEYKLEAPPYYYFNRGNGTFRNVVIMSSDSSLPPFATPTTTTTELLTTASSLVNGNEQEIDNAAQSTTSVTVQGTNPPQQADGLVILFLVIGLVCFAVCVITSIICFIKRRSKAKEEKQERNHANMNIMDMEELQGTAAPLRLSSVYSKQPASAMNPLYGAPSVHQSYAAHDAPYIDNGDSMVQSSQQLPLSLQASHMQLPSEPNHMRLINTSTSEQFGAEGDVAANGGDGHELEDGAVDGVRVTGFSLDNSSLPNPMVSAVVGGRGSVFSVATNTEGKVRTHVHVSEHENDNEDALEPLNGAHETLREESLSSRSDHAKQLQLLKPAMAGQQVYSVEMDASGDEEIYGDDETKGKSLD